MGRVARSLNTKVKKHLSPLLVVCALAAFCGACSHSTTNVGDSWNRKAAATYLDQREGTWAAWPHAARDRGTFCVSCHTAMPYALSRQAIDFALAPDSIATNERKLLDNVAARVRLWNEIKPYYPSQVAASRGTEAVLNALVLANADARSGKLSSDTRLAFNEMWVLQQTTGTEQGGWQWIEFNNEPWEAYDSAFYGATLAAIATSLAPENYRSSPEIQSNLDLLRQYLNREYSRQTLLNQVSLLWASAKIPGILSAEQQQSIVGEILVKQQPDGGWSASSLVGTWKRHDKTALVARSDGYATGLVTYVLQQVGLGRDEPHVKGGLHWLVQNQRWGGQWSAYSLNKRRLNPFSIPSSFMDDAATAYAVLALTEAGAQPGGMSALQKPVQSPPQTASPVSRAQ